MEICNVGENAEIGDYDVRTLRGRNKEQLDKHAITRQGKVSGYPRLAIHVWHLVSEALKAVKYDRR